MRNRKIAIFFLLNAAIVFWCARLFYLGQSFASVAIVAAISFVVLNAVAAIAWHLAQKRTRER